jgi:hypothetical protein
MTSFDRTACQRRFNYGGAEMTVLLLKGRRAVSKKSQCSQTATTSSDFTYKGVVAFSVISIALVGTVLPYLQWSFSPSLKIVAGCAGIIIGATIARRARLHATSDV